MKKSVKKAMAAAAAAIIFAGIPMTVPAEGGVPCTAVYAAASDALSGFKMSYGTGSVTLSWNKAEGADAYRVYMYDSAAKKYVKYKDVKSGKVTVKGLESGASYKFRVCALKKNGKKYSEGTLSKVISAKMPAETSDYKSLYKSYLKQIIRESEKNGDNAYRSMYFNLYDLDGDNVPELFLSRWASHSDKADIYTAKEGKLVYLGDAGSHGVAAVSGEYLADVYVGQITYVNIMTMKDGKLAYTEKFDDCSNFTDKDAFKINGKVVSEKEYNNVFEKYRNEMTWYSVGAVYSLFDTDIDKLFDSDNCVPDINKRDKGLLFDLEFFKV